MATAMIGTPAILPVSHFLLQRLLGVGGTMPEPRKYKVMIAFFSYGGNGGMMSEHPDVRDWLVRTLATAKNDRRISETTVVELADTPITMCRNKAVLDARELGVDILVMIDSDQSPDCEPGAPAWWDTAFDFLDSMYDTHPVVIGAPYCGPPPMESVYVFRWQNCATNNVDECDMQLKAFTRYEAALQAGTRPVGALPTGLIMYDMRVFDLIDPTPRYRQLRDLGLTSSEAARACPKWFDYEWKNQFGSEKGSTEDVLNTRDLSLVGIQKYGRNPVYCTWDCWAGHWKPKLVRKPQILSADSVSRSLADVVLRGNESGLRIEQVSFKDDSMLAEVV